MFSNKMNLMEELWMQNRRVFSPVTQTMTYTCMRYFLSTAQGFLNKKPEVHRTFGLGN